MRSGILSFKKMLRILISFLLLILVSFRGNSQEIPDTGFTDLEATEFYVIMKSNEDRIIIDTRTWKEYRRERIPGAVLAADRQELISVSKHLDFEQPVLVYCSDDFRSKSACGILVERGFTNVYNLNGGLIQWKMAGYEIDKKKAPRKQGLSYR